ncbi:MAG TPA: ACT domain-containing protein [Bacillota bacterium]|nr:ACT domain-containing protein [Bacillota bacterium]
MAKDKENVFYIVNRRVLPQVFHNVMKAKMLLATGEAKTVNDAVKKAGISRSAFYKYKDSVFSFSQANRGKIITLSLTLLDLSGVLSTILNAVALRRGNILTINQNIPIHGVANVTISVDTRQMEHDQERMIHELNEIKGVQRIEVIGQE